MMKKKCSRWLYAAFYFKIKIRIKLQRSKRRHSNQNTKSSCPREHRKEEKKLRFIPLFARDLIVRSFYVKLYQHPEMKRLSHLYLIPYCLSRCICARSGVHRLGRKTAHLITHSVPRVVEIWRTDESWSKRVKTNDGWQLCSQLTEVWQLGWFFWKENQDWLKTYK